MYKNKEKLEKCDLLLMKTGRSAVKYKNLNYYDSLVKRYKKQGMTILLFYRCDDKEELKVKKYIEGKIDINGNSILNIKKGGFIYESKKSEYIYTDLLGFIDLIEFYC